MALSPWLSIRRHAIEALLVATVTVIGRAAPPSTSTPPASEVIFSSTRRFALRTTDRARDVPLLAMLENVAGRLEDALGMSMPTPVGRPWLVIIERGQDAGPPRAIREADRGSRGMGRTLRLIQPEELPPSTILVGIVAGMAARYVSARQSPEEADVRPRWPPEWFAAGLAGTLYPAPRQVWLRRASDEWNAGRDPSLDELLAVNAGQADPPTLPFLTALVVWLRRQPNFPRLADWILQAAATGARFGPAELATALDPSWSPKDLAQAWDLAMGGLRRLETPWAEPREHRIGRIREAITLSQGQIPIALPPDVPRPITPAVLVSANGAPWVPPLAMQMRSALLRVPVGKDQELRELTRELQQVLAALSQADDGLLDRVLRRLRRGLFLRRLAVTTRRLDDLEAIAIVERASALSPTPNEVEELIRRDAVLFETVSPH